MFEPSKINDIQRYSALSEQVAELAKSITSACEIFIEREISDQSAKYRSWMLNERKTLLIIEYSYLNEYNDTEFERINCSFDEIQNIIDENKPKIKSFNP